MAPEHVDLLVVGAGPAGLSAAAQARARGLSYALLERSDHLADTIFCYQKRKHVMAEPAQIPLRSELIFAPGSRESVLAAWSKFVQEHGLNVRYQQELVGLTPDGEGFLARTQNREYHAAKVILAIGTQGNPRKLGAPGEDLPHVATRLVDPADFVDKTIVVVGAGDSAIEVALALCARNRVYLVVRKSEVARGKESLARELQKQATVGQIEILYSTTVRQILPGAIELTGAKEEVRLQADQVFLKIGTQAPRRFLESLGVEFVSADPEAKPVLKATYESNVRGLYVIGATTGRDLIRLCMNQGHEVVEHVLGRQVEPADEEILKANLPFWEGSVRERIGQVMSSIPLFGATGIWSGGGQQTMMRTQVAAAREQLRETFLSAQARTYRAGETILRQDDYTNSVLTIVSGGVEVERRNEQGVTTKLGTLGPGDFFGEMALISGRRRMATVRAAAETRVLEIPRKAMLKLLYGAPVVQRMVDDAFVLRSFQGLLAAQVSIEKLAPVAAKATLERRDKNYTIFREGDPGDAFYLIRSGQVKLSKISGDQEIVITYLVAGNFFGEAALLSNEPCSMTATTIFPCELIRLASRDFNAFLAQYPGLRARLQKELEASRLATLKEVATAGAGRVLSELIREEVVMGTDALIIDEHKCIRCNNCIRACEDVHDDGQARLSLSGVKFANILAPNSCWQCENPLCMLDCPPDALYRDAGGEIHIRDNCIGCGNCEANCPYGNIFMVHPKPQSSLLSWLKGFLPGEAGGSDRTVAVKCDLCSSLNAGPACVRGCPTGAAIRVKAEDYQSTLQKLMFPGGGW